MIQIILIIITLPLLLTLAETLIWFNLLHQQTSTKTPSKNNWQNAIVFLTGISDYKATNLQPEQINFIQNISKHFPADIAIAEPFPYEKITAQKYLPLDIWDKIRYKSPPLLVISLHNFWQTIFSAWFPKTHGKIVAKCLINRLGIPETTHSNLIFICGSVGANIALTATPILTENWQIRVSIISYGGVFGSTSAFDSIDHFYHLVGKQDNWTKIGKILFPQRLLSRGGIAKARQENRYSIHYTGEHTHMGYLSEIQVNPTQLTYQDLTLKTVIQLPIWEKLSSQL
ncbi:hypothetical protein [Oscillatoria salina]|uniref:hypothetical protein n=1 Tax=Oscillatoria salina TaxID=331517 RepID=UPI0013BC5A14|nr:hypothetical protein [Oscillatoria salina]MBZ8182504.1 hypothetical protein [Oscillatoria salina IIICB1]NET86973.1 hypothetical protein [Kamptonema sp. SIO1D9]